MTKIVEMNESLLSINDDAARVEQGPPMLEGFVTDDPAKIDTDEDLLHNLNTALHYQVGGFDAKGKIIARGQTISYLDWLKTRVWYAYKHTSEPTFDGFGNPAKDAEGNPIMVERFVEVGVADTKDEAIALACASIGADVPAA